jgi:hypothetical protein
MYPTLQGLSFGDLLGKSSGCHCYDTVDCTGSVQAFFHSNSDRPRASGSATPTGYGERRWARLERWVGPGLRGG